MARDYIEDGKFVSDSLTTCPYCGSSNIEGNGTDYDWSEYEPREMAEDVTCLDCGKHWKDVFAYTYSLEDLD